MWRVRIFRPGFPTALSYLLLPRPVSSYLVLPRPASSSLSFVPHFSIWNILPARIQLGGSLSRVLRAKLRSSFVPEGQSHFDWNLRSYAPRTPTKTRRYEWVLISIKAERNANERGRSLWKDHCVSSLYDSKSQINESTFFLQSLNGSPIL